MDRSSTGVFGRGRAAAGKTTMIMVGAVGVWLVGNGLSTPEPPPQPTTAQAFTTQPAPATSLPPGRQDTLARPAAPVAAFPAMPASTPTRIRIPAIKVNAALTGLKLGADRKLIPPPEADRALAGWYTGSAAPGVIGTAIITGHVDNEQGPAVFYFLGALRKSDAIDVDRADGTTAVFTVDAIEAYPADDFPSGKVYGWASRAELRIITCGAGFDKRRNQYRGNVVVYAHLAAPLGR